MILISCDLHWTFSLTSAVIYKTIHGTTLRYAQFKLARMALKGSISQKKEEEKKTPQCCDTNLISVFSWPTLIVGMVHVDCTFSSFFT